MEKAPFRTDLVIRKVCLPALSFVPESFAAVNGLHLRRGGLTSGFPESPVRAVTVPERFWEEVAPTAADPESARTLPRGIDSEYCVQLSRER